MNPSKNILAYLGKHFKNLGRTLANLSILSWVIQLTGLGCVIYGVSLYSHPVAFIFGGVVAVVAIETQSRGGDPPLTDEETREIQKRIQTALANHADPFSQPGVPLNPLWITYVATLQKQRKPVE